MSHTDTIKKKSSLRVARSRGSVPAVLFFPSPLIPAIYVSHPPDNGLFALSFGLTIIGCFCSITWFTKTRSWPAKIGTGLLCAWYLLFSILGAYRMLRLGL